MSIFAFSTTPPEGITIYDPAILAKMPTIAQGQADDLKLETAGGTLRYWLSRCGKEDGEPWRVHVERFEHGVWACLFSYRRKS